MLDGCDAFKVTLAKGKRSLKSVRWRIWGCNQRGSRTLITGQMLFDTALVFKKARRPSPKPPRRAFLCLKPKRHPD